MRELQELPNVGPATAGDLVRLGIKSADDLIDRDPVEMYDALCRKDGAKHDPCLLDVFMALVAFANGAPANPWWHYTPRRKALLKKRSAQEKT
jgi:hypothetical protein